MMVSELKWKFDLLFINRKRETDICIYILPKRTLNSEKLSKTKILRSIRQLNTKITVMFSLTYNRQTVQTAKLSMRLQRSMKYLLPSFDLFMDVIKSTFIASTISHPSYEGYGVSLNSKWIILTFALYRISRMKTNICATQYRAVKSSIPASQNALPRPHHR